MAILSSELQRSRELLGGYSRVVERQAIDKSSSGIVDVVAAHLFPIRDGSAAESRARARRATLCSIVGVIAALFFREPLLLALPVAVLLFERRALHAKMFKAAESFERDYPALLLSLASGVRTGLDPFVALCTSRELFPVQSQMHRELSAVAEAAAQGKSEEESIRAFAASVPHPDLELFRAAFILARREGASLAEALQRLARVTRQRQSFRRKMRAAVAMQKLSAIGIALCTLVIGIMQAGANPAAFQLALAHPVGSRALIGGVCLVVIGLLWMLSLSRSRL